MFWIGIETEIEVQLSLCVLLDRVTETVSMVKHLVLFTQCGSVKGNFGIGLEYVPLPEVFASRTNMNKTTSSGIRCIK